MVAYQNTAQPQKCYPSAAAGIALTPNASSWVNSAYVQLHASTPGAWLITGITVIPSQDVSGGDRQFELDIAVGAAASEVVKGTVKAGSNSVAHYTNENLGFLPIQIPFLVAAGQRIAIRMRKNGTNTSQFTGIALTYLDSPNTDVQSTSNLLRVTPSAANMIHVTDAASWANSATFTTIVASCAADFCILGVAYQMYLSTGQFELDLASGVAASEVVKYTLRGLTHGKYTGCNYIPLPIPLTAFVTGNRISARVRHSSASTSVGLDIGLVYYHTPL